jgi:uncharacterized protein DUF6491
MTPRYLLAAALLISCAANAGGTNPPPRHELPFGDCLRTDRINDWHMMDDRTVAVRNGPHYFVVRTTVNCPRMDLGGGIHFRTSQSVRAVGGMRICGGIGEEIVRRDDPPCQIQSVQIVDKAQYENLAKKAKRHGSGAEPNGSVP